MLSFRFYPAAFNDMIRANTATNTAFIQALNHTVVKGKALVASITDRNYESWTAVGPFWLY